MTPWAVLVVPCYNEARRLRCEVFREYLSRHPDVVLLFVDDGSEDDTGAVLAALREEAGERVRILALETNAGKGEAVRRGLVAALAFDPHFIGFLDADLGTPLEEVTSIARLLDTRPEAWMAVGSRIPMLGRRILRRRSRYLAGRLLGLMAYPILGAVLHDTQCGAKLLRAGTDASSLLAEPFLSPWIFDIELLARMRHAAETRGLVLRDVVIEVPLGEWQERGGSKVRASDYLRASLALVRMVVRYRVRGAGASGRAPGR